MCADREHESGPSRTSLVCEPSVEQRRAREEPRHDQVLDIVNGYHGGRLPDWRDHRRQREVEALKVIQPHFCSKTARRAGGKKSSEPSRTATA